MVEAWEKEGGFGPSASWQAVICMNTETAQKYTTRRPTLPGRGERPIYAFVLRFAFHLGFGGSSAISGRKAG